MNGCHECNNGFKKGDPWQLFDTRRKLEDHNYINALENYILTGNIPCLDCNVDVEINV